jgi:hypothetical protein
MWAGLSHEPAELKEIELEVKDLIKRKTKQNLL